MRWSERRKFSVFCFSFVDSALQREITVFASDAWIRLRQCRGCAHQRQRPPLARRFSRHA
jgi:hypothetical protein